MPAFDLVIRNATLVDGTGAPPRSADVAVAGERIAAIGTSLHGDARDTVDATGLTLAPGFIDVHTHDDGALLTDPAMLTLHPGAPLTTRFLPAVVSATGQPVLLTGSAKTSAEKHYADLRGCTGLTAAPGRTP